MCTAFNNITLAQRERGDYTQFYVGESDKRDMALA